MTANFLTEDSYLGSINEPLTLNRYNYCISSYPNYEDPGGNTFDPISEGQRLELMYLLTGDEEYSKQAEEQLRDEMEVTYYGAKKSLSLIKDIFSGIGTSALRNLRQMFEPVVVPTKALDSMFMGHGFDYSGIRDSYRAETISFEKGRAAEAENLTAFYAGECIGDVLTVAIIMQCAKAATAGGSQGSMGGRNVMIANMVTADGTVVAVEVESGGAVVGVMGAFPDPGYGSGYGSGGVDDSFGNLWESVFGVKKVAERPGNGFRTNSSYLSNQKANKIKSEILEGKDVKFKTKEEALEFIEKKFPNFKEETAGNRSSEGWHFDSHPIEGSEFSIEHINIYSKSQGFRVHITWGD